MTAPSSQNMTESRFYMWRAVFALAHADHIVTDEERKFMVRILATEGFSEEQETILRQDMETAQEVGNMFLKVSDPEDRSQFFYFARMLLWSDGDFAQQEQKLLTELGKDHFKSVDFDHMIGTVDMELEDAHKEWLIEDMQEEHQEDGVKGIFDRFMKRFRG